MMYGYGSGVGFGLAGWLGMLGMIVVVIGVVLLIAWLVGRVAPATRPQPAAGQPSRTRRPRAAAAAVRSRRDHRGRVSVREAAPGEALARDPGVVLTRQQLLETVWGIDFVGDDHVLEVHVGNLRRKLGDEPADPRYVETVRGVGYRLRAGHR